MSLSKLTTNLNIIQQLEDEPNDVSGMTAEALKTEFDKSGNAIKTYLNDTLTAEVDEHIANVSNPHSVTKAQVGLGNADNTSDANKPVSTAQQAALDLKSNISSVLTKTNTTAFTPTADYHPSTKKYVDDVAVGLVIGQIPDGSLTEEKLDTVVDNKLNGDHEHTKSQITDFPASMTPTAHAASHKTGGTDAMTASDIGAAASSHTHGNITSAGQISGVTLDAKLVRLVSGILTALDGTTFSAAKIVTGTFVGVGNSSNRQLTLPVQAKLFFAYSTDGNTRFGIVFPQGGLVCSNGTVGGQGYSYYNITGYVVTIMGQAALDVYNEHYSYIAIE